jgi:hypothetical protein
MNKYEIFLIEESVLIDDLVKLCYQKSLIKNASLFDEIGLSSIGSSIVNHFKSAFHYGEEDVPGGFLIKVLNVISPSLLFRISPFLGGIYLLATSMFDVDLIDIIKSIIKKFSSKIENKEQIEPSEIQQMMSSSDVTAYKKDISELIKLAYKDQSLIKTAKRGFGDSEKFDFPWMATDRKLGLMQRLFGKISKLKGRRLILGIAMWFVKNLFLGLGLLAVGGAAAKFLGVKKEENNQEQQEVKQDVEQQPAQNNVQHSQPLPKQNKQAWMVPLVGNKTVEDTLRIWALDLYPELNKNPEIDSIIFRSNKFRELVRHLKSDYKKISSRFLIMPDEFETRKQVVDKFIEDVKKDVK